MEKVYDVFCLGEVLIDYFSSKYCLSLDKVEKFEGYFGGSVANVAVNLKREGKKPYFLAKVGEDKEGKYIGRVLAKEKVANSLLADKGLKTSRVFILKTKKLLPDSFYNKWNNYYRDADYQISQNEINLDYFLQSKWFHTDAFSLIFNPIRETIFYLVKKARKSNIKISFDLNFRQKNWPKTEEGRKIVKEFLNYVDLLKLSDEDAGEFLGKKPIKDYLPALNRFGPESVIITAGEKGVWFVDQGKINYLKTKKIKKIISSTGAGDAFTASLLASIIDGKILREVVEVAIIKSSAVLNKWGAFGEIEGIKKPEIRNNIFK